MTANAVIKGKRCLEIRSFCPLSDDNFESFHNLCQRKLVLFLLVSFILSCSCNEDGYGNFADHDSLNKDKFMKEGTNWRATEVRKRFELFSGRKPLIFRNRLRCFRLSGTYPIFQTKSKHRVKQK